MRIIHLYRITGELFNLSPGLHGFHVHELGDLSDNCAGAGGHYNPFGRNHGAPYDEDRHVGDLGNIEFGELLEAEVSIQDHLVKLGGDTSVIGRAIVVHEGTDDLGRGGYEDSLTTGHAGPRAACCLIEAAEDSAAPGLSAVHAASTLTLALGVTLVV